MALTIANKQVCLKLSRTHIHILVFTVILEKHKTNVFNEGVIWVNSPFENKFQSKH